MTTTLSPVRFDQPDLAATLSSLSDAELDDLEFGVIAIDAEEVVCRYNALESKMAGLSPDRVVGKPLFDVVAPCMNNYLVAQRLQDAASAGEPLDAVVDYVLTLRMRPTKVKLRLLAVPGDAHRYVLILRNL
jgi:photoactive yellow protein